MNQHRHQSRPHRDAAQHAVAIAQAVDTTWNKSNHSGRRDVALSVVAALALLGHRDPHGHGHAEQLRAQNAEDFSATLREIYTAVLNTRPDVAHLVFPLMEWIFDDPQPSVQQAAKRTANAALEEGQLELTGTDKRHDTDLLGIVLTMLKSDTAGKANAQIYTPGPLADGMTRMSPPEEHSSVCDPAVGTGGLLRAAAQAMREHDRDPTTVAWYGADVDELAIAACAVNALAWQLGPRIVLCVANTLSEGDWPRRAEAQRAELLQLSQTIRRDKTMLNDANRREEFVLRRIRAGRTRMPIGPGTFLGSRGYAPELARGLHLVLEAGQELAGDVFNLCEASCAPMRLWAEQIVRAAGAELELVEVPDTALPADLALTGAIAQHLLADPGKAARRLGWVHAPAEELVRRSVTWHLAHPPEQANPDFDADDRALPPLRPNGL